MIKPGDEPIPGYRVEQMLGRGQFGQVWRARSPGNTAVALKFLELSGAHGWKEFRAIQRVKQIRHAHLMPIVAIWLLDEQGQVLGDDVIESMASTHDSAGDTLTASGTLVVQPVKTSQRPAQLIVATLLADQSLGDRLRACRDEGLPGIPRDELLGFMTEAAKGLDFLNSTQHKIGDAFGAVQHCDVKPDNIMLTGGSVVITDFGVAQTLAQARANTTATSLGGTPAYMAPELFVNKPSRASDQYSLALTYYELRTGKLPFHEHTYAAVYQAHRDGNLDLSDCTPAEQAVLRRATAVDPDERFESCAEFIEKLCESVRPESLAPAKRGRRSWLGMAATALVAAAIGSGIFWGLNREPPVPMGRIVLAVQPADATVTIDGEPVQANAAGMVIAERPLGKAFVVKASKPPEWSDGELEITPQESEQRRELKLEPSAVHFANEAERLVAGGTLSDAAVTALAEAIRRDPETYALVPAPIVAAAGSAAIAQMRMASGGRRLAIASADGALWQWSLEGEAPAKTGTIVHRHAGEVLSLATAGDWTASIADPDNAIVLCHADGRKLTLTILDEGALLARIAFANDGRTLVAASEVLNLVVEPERRAWALHAWSLEADDIAGSRQQLEERENEFEPLLVGAHRAAWVVLAARSAEGWIVRHCPVDEPAASTPIHEQAGDVRALAVSGDDRRIVVGGGAVSSGSDGDDYKATLIDAASQRAVVLRRAHRGAIAAAAFDAAGRMLATSDEDGDVQAWPLPDEWDGSRPPRDEPVFLTGQSGALVGLAVPTAGWVVSGVDGRVALWDCDAKPPRPLVLAAEDADVTALATTPDGQWLITGHDDGALRFWSLPRLMLLLRACAAAGEEPRGAAPADGADLQATRFDRPSRPARHSPAGSSETASRRPRRPNAARVG